MINFKARFAAVIGLTLCSTSLIADEYHYNNMLIGNRASGLAGAYTAISDDSTGLFYNPAGIVFSQDLQLSASANAIHSSTLSYKNVLNGGDFERKSSTIVPNFFGMTSKLGDGYFGFSYAITDFDVEDQDTLFTSIPGIPLYILNINNFEKVSRFGPSYALKINDQFDFGVTLYFYEREKELINNQWIRLPDDSFEWSNFYAESSETGFEPVFGFMWTPDDSFSLGLSLRKVFITSAKTRTQLSCSSDINNILAQSPQCISVNSSPINPTIGTSDVKRDMPLNIRLGVAYFPTPTLLYSADVSIFESINSDSSNIEEVINLSLGIEYYFNASWAIRGGYYTNNTNTAEVQTGQVNQKDHVDLTGVSLSITKFSKTSSITIGFTGSSGDGKAQVIADSSEIQDLEQTVSTLYLSTSYSF